MLRIVFFMRRPNVELAESVVDALYRILDTLPPGAISLFAAGSGDWLKRQDKGIRAAIHKRLLGNEKAINGALDLASDDDNIPVYAVSYTGYALDLPMFADDAGRLEIHVARPEALRLAGELERLADELASMLDFTHGYMDLALLGRRGRLQALANRHHGVDIASLSTLSQGFGDRAAGAYWINYFKGRLLDTLGGAAAIEAALSPGAGVQTLAGGAVKVRLGTQPTQGDIDAPQALDDRRALTRLLVARDALHIPTDSIYFEGEDDEDDDLELQIAWHSRFIEKE